MSYLGLNIAKPAKPLKKKDLYIFPVTSADQIIYDNPEFGMENVRLKDIIDEIVANYLNVIGNYISVDNGNVNLIYGEAKTVNCAFSNADQNGSAFLVSEGYLITAQKKCIVSILGEIATMNKHYDSSGNVTLYININGEQTQIWTKNINADNQSGSDTLYNISLNKGDVLYFQVKTDAALQVYGFSGKISVTSV